MMLKDCPVGSVVRLVSWHGHTDYELDNWEGKFGVFEYNGVNCVKDGCGVIRDDISGNEYYQFEIVSQPKTPNNHARQITLDGVTYRLTPHTEPRLIVIDGVTYEMEEI